MAQGGFCKEGWPEAVRFDIPYSAIIPKENECENLLVPVCASSSAVAFCAIRLEPTWMHLGEAAGIAAFLSINAGKNVQSIQVSELQEKTGR
ncbi:MAG: FAD-dependent oxidoreductase [Verrucomicrobiae bacterium]|nr:FAD-dependent oxidoreductase [Verrucomicrobiae bacterium]